MLLQNKITIFMRRKSQAVKHLVNYIRGNDLRWNDLYAYVILISEIYGAMPISSKNTAGMGESIKGPFKK